MAQHIWFLNRGLVLLRPKAPFVDWVRAADPADDPLPDEIVRASTSAYLVPELESDEATLKWVQSNAGFLFDFALNEWYTDEALWPKGRGWKKLQEWFDIEVVDLVWDLVDEPLTSDPDAPEHQL